MNKVNALLVSKLFFFIGIFVFTCKPVFSQCEMVTLDWEQLKGFPDDLKIIGGYEGVLFAHTSKEFFKSSDEGNLWQKFYSVPVSNFESKIVKCVYKDGTILCKIEKNHVGNLGNNLLTTKIIRSIEYYS